MIQKWKIKALVQKTISILPFSEKLNYIFQKHVTGGIELTEEYWGYKITHARDHINFYKSYDKNGLNGKTALELGTGWYPIVPVCLFLSNIDKVISIDIKSWMTKSFQIKAIAKVVDSRKTGKLESYLTEINEERWDILEGILKKNKNLTRDEINRIICLETVIKDARRTNLPDKSIDFICSNNTFEHIRQDILFDILKEFRRIIKDDGIMSHFIDMSDHFSHYDTSITNYNFLKYSENVWKLIDNSIQPQNRLRFIDYKRMYEKLNIPVSMELITGSRSDQLRQIKISKQYKNYTEDELVISHGYIVSKMDGE
jgi:ubiquinone/menaquinone biosynthesis C-methylase UbiE